MEGMAGEGSFASPARPHHGAGSAGGTSLLSPAGAHSGTGGGALLRGAGHQSLVEMDEALFAEIEGDREVRDDGWLRLKVGTLTAGPALCCQSRA